MISSAANQLFTVGDAATAASTITITEDAVQASISALDDIRIRIPLTANLTWDISDLSVLLGGTASGKVSTTLLPYEDGGKTVVLDVTANFAATDTLTIDGLTFANFTAPSSAQSLGLDIFDTGTDFALDDKTVQVVAPGSALMLSANDQTFFVGHPSTGAASILVSDATIASITAANDIRIRIPAGFNMTWDTSITSVTLSGPQATNVLATLLPYEDSGRTMVLDVGSDFGGGDTFTVSGMRFQSFTALSATDNLELVIAGAGGATEDEDDQTITITDLTLSSAADQYFSVGQAPTAAQNITVRDASSAPTVTAVNDIRIRVPAGFSMTWDSSVATVTLGGAAAGRVLTAVTYEDSDQTVVLDVISNFAASDAFTICRSEFHQLHGDRAERQSRARGRKRRRRCSTRRQAHLHSGRRLPLDRHQYRHSAQHGRGDGPCQHADGHPVRSPAGECRDRRPHRAGSGRAQPRNPLHRLRRRRQYSHASSRCRPRP